MKKQQTQYNVISEYYAEHVSELRIFVSSRIKATDEAEDIVQNIFLKLLTANDVLTPNTLASLVYTMARNMIYDYYRHRRAVEEYISFADRSDRCSCSVQSVYSAAEIHELLERGIATLKESQRRVYRLNVYDGMPVSDISKTLNMNYKTVESKLGMARKEIRRYITRMLA